MTQSARHSSHIILFNIHTQRIPPFKESFLTHILLLRKLKARLLQSYRGKRQSRASHSEPTTRKFSSFQTTVLERFRRQRHWSLPPATLEGNLAAFSSPSQLSRKPFIRLTTHLLLQPRAGLRGNRAGLGWPSMGTTDTRTPRALK